MSLKSVVNIVTPRVPWLQNFSIAQQFIYHFVNDNTNKFCTFLNFIFYFSTSAVDKTRSENLFLSLLESTGTKSYFLGLGLAPKQKNNSFMVGVIFRGNPFLPHGIKTHNVLTQIKWVF